MSDPVGSLPTSNGPVLGTRHRSTCPNPPSGRGFVSRGQKSRFVIFFFSSGNRDERTNCVDDLLVWGETRASRRSLNAAGRRYMTVAVVFTLCGDWFGRTHGGQHGGLTVFAIRHYFNSGGHPSGRSNAFSAVGSGKHSRCFSPAGLRPVSSGFARSVCEHGGWG